MISSITGSAILAFGLCNIHAVSDIAEGGVLGAALLFDHWLGISPAVSGAILNIICYYVGFRQLGKTFIAYSLLSTVAFSLSYAIFAPYSPLVPQISDYPFLASVVGAIFVGIGVGICIRAGSAPGGDDALALALSHRYGCKIERIYLITDVTVLFFSLTYIPFQRMIYSIFTVILSGQIVGWVQRWRWEIIRKRNIG